MQLVISLHHIGSFTRCPNTLRSLVKFSLWVKIIISLDYLRSLSYNSLCMLVNTIHAYHNKCKNTLHFGICLLAEYKRKFAWSKCLNFVNLKNFTIMYVLRLFLKSRQNRKCIKIIFALFLVLLK